ncbi:MAG TPA: PorV/PorQ family protein [Bacteroidales bacterium]|nr:PorV/PorQ family protein [Bacteroidales bacterium]HNS47462.1 PorV/PorQ family protein [Bacteroidales bacterium]
MKQMLRYIPVVIFTWLMIAPGMTTLGGNKDRSGEAGASELLINPWARSAGWGGVNTANIKGVESMFTNIAGTAFINRTDITFGHTTWLKGSDINIYSFGLVQKIGQSGALGIGVMSMSFGDIPITTVNLPEGGIGTFSPSLLNFALSYSRMFSNSIYGGLQLKVVSESISDISAVGFAIDAGIQYVTGETDNIHFGITLRNWGPTMRFSGDGLAIRTLLPGQESQFTVEQRAAAYQLPSQLNIGAAYDINFKGDYRLTFAANFVSNAFAKDQITGGLEFSLKDYLVLRGGYTYEDGITEDADRTTVFTGPSAGFSVQIPLKKDSDSKFYVDYSYTDTDPFDGVHRIGAGISF